MDDQGRELEDVKREQDKTLQELKTTKEDLEMTKKELEKIKATVETANQEHGTTLQELVKIKEELKAAYEELGNRCQQIEHAGTRIEKFVLDLDAAGNWGSAAEGYEELYRMETSKLGHMISETDKEAVREIKSNSLKFRHKLVEVLIKEHKTEEAEPIAREVWESRKASLPPNSPDTRASLLNYCHILRLNKNYEMARRLYNMELLSEHLKQSDPNDRQWMHDNEFELGCVSAEMEEYGEAEYWFRKVLKKVVRGLPQGLNDAVKSAVKIISIFKKQEKDIDKELSNYLEQIWNHRDSQEVAKDVLACGHELGVYFQHRGEDGKAELTLRNVLEEWKEKRILQDDMLQDAISSAECLLEVYEGLENYKEAEKVLKWICDKKPIELNNPDTLKCRYKLAYLRLELRDNIAAEAVLSAIWLELKTAPKESNIDSKLECGYIYGYVLAESRKWPSAREVLESALAEIGTQTLDVPWLEEVRQLASDLLNTITNPPVEGEGIVNTETNGGGEENTRSGETGETGITGGTGGTVESGRTGDNEVRVNIETNMGSEENTNTERTGNTGGTGDARFILDTERRVGNGWTGDNRRAGGSGHITTHHPNISKLSNLSRYSRRSNIKPPKTQFQKDLQRFFSMR